MFMGAFDEMMMDDLEFMNRRSPGKKSKGRGGKFGKGRSATRARRGPGGMPGMHPGMAAMFADMDDLDDDLDDDLLFELLGGMDGPRPASAGGKKKKKGKKDDPSEEEMAMLLEMMMAGGLDDDLDDDLDLDPGMAEMLFAMGKGGGKGDLDPGMAEMLFAMGKGGGKGGPLGPQPTEKRGGARRKARGRR